MNYNTHMKYKYGDILYHILSSSPYYAGATVVQVLEYDEIRKNISVLFLIHYVLIVIFSLYIFMKRN